MPRAETAEGARALWQGDVQMLEGQWSQGVLARLTYPKGPDEDDIIRSTLHRLESSQPHLRRCFNVTNFFLQGGLHIVVVLSLASRGLLILVCKLFA